MQHVLDRLLAIQDKTVAEHSARFFKTGKGEYGEGDLFLGIRVPDIRSIVRKNKDASFDEIAELFVSKYHEARLCAALLCIEHYKQEAKAGYEFYLNHIDAVNNWDLVDSSAPYIIGDYLLDKDKTLLYEFAKSENLWRRRIAIIATFTFIRANRFEDTLKISDILLNDEHDLIHKAVGWMLRELGKRDQKVLENFLKPRYKKMPRTMLRYAIEKFPKDLYQTYLEGKI